MTKAITLPELVPSLWFPLVKKFYQEHYPSGKPNKADPIWAIRHNGKVICAVRLKQIETHQLLTAMATASEHRGQGIGHIMLNGLTAQQVLKNCYCFSLPHLTRFYQQHHFQEISATQLPAELRSRFVAYTQHGRQLIPMQYMHP
ncbi:GNAT family N-acetyltransferase [Marinomonas epiphytica]